MVVNPATMSSGWLRTSSWLSTNPKGPSLNPRGVREFIEYKVFYRATSQQEKFTTHTQSCSCKIPLMDNKNNSNNVISAVHFEPVGP